MREVVFLKKNEKKWRKVEQIIDVNNNLEPDEMADLFIEMSDDLSYSKTNYKESNTTKYLNSLASGIYNTIHRNKKDKIERIADFWLKELPLAFARSHRQLLYSFLFFSVAMLIGAVSTAFDDSFVRLILGDAYVNETLENINRGDPMAIYKSSGETEMFYMITLNNLKVALKTFVFGILLSFGTYYILFYNGIMLGAFQYFFYTKGLFIASFLSIWIHGTIEISCIVMAGAAGIVLGNSLLYPGTYKRTVSFTRGAKKALKISLGLVPLIIIAGFLESFVTRHTEFHWIFRLGIIVISAASILTYFVIYPKMLLHKVSGYHRKRYALFATAIVIAITIPLAFLMSTGVNILALGGAGVGAVSLGLFLLWIFEIPTSEGTIDPMLSIREMFNSSEL